MSIGEIFFYFYRQRWRQKLCPKTLFESLKTRQHLLGRPEPRHPHPVLAGLLEDRRPLCPGIERHPFQVLELERRLVVGREVDRALAEVHREGDHARDDEEEQ